MKTVCKIFFLCIIFSLFSCASKPSENVQSEKTTEKSIEKIEQQKIEDKKSEEKSNEKSEDKKSEEKLTNDEDKRIIDEKKSDEIKSDEEKKVLDENLTLDEIAEGVELERSDVIAIISVVQTPDESTNDFSPDELPEEIAAETDFGFFDDEISNSDFFIPDAENVFLYESDSQLPDVLEPTIAAIPNEKKNAKPKKELTSTPNGQIAIVKKSTAPVKPITKSSATDSKSTETKSTTKKTSTQKSSVQNKKSANQGTVQTDAMIEDPTVTTTFAENQTGKNSFDATDLLERARAEFKKKKYQNALSILDEFFLKSTEKLDEGYFLRGQIYEAFSDLGNIKKARESYSVIVSIYPQSAFYQKAKERIIYIDRFYFNVW